MKKNRFNFWLAVVMFVNITLMVITALSMEEHGGPNAAGGGGYGNLAPGGGGGHFLKELHGVLGVVLVIAVIIHIALHWKWIVCQFKAVFGGSVGQDACSEESEKKS